jgi:arginine:ornithine antiporter / lysine permease
VYGWWVAWRGEGQRSARRASDAPIAAVAAGYCVWLLYAAGLKYLLLSALLYAAGAGLYIWAKRQRDERPFTGQEWGILGVIVLLAVVAAAMLATGRLGL